MSQSAYEYAQQEAAKYMESDDFIAAKQKAVRPSLFSFHLGLHAMATYMPHGDQFAC